MADHHLVFLEDHIVLAAGIDAALRAFDVAEVFEQYLHHTGEIGFLLEARPRILRMRHVEAHLISRGVDRCRPEMMRIEAALPRIDVEVGEDGVDVVHPFARLGMVYRRMREVIGHLLATARRDDVGGVDRRIGEAFDMRLLARNIVGVAVQRGAAMRAEEVRSEEHTSELQSLMRTSYAVFCLKKKK